MAASLYPDVPVAPGVPPVLREIGEVEATAILLVADAAILAQNLAGLFLAPQWGLFDQTGQLALAADSVRAFDFRQDFDVPHYPIEQGSFAQYNKVQVPFDVRLELTIGDSALPNLPGSQVARRAAFLAAAAAVCASLQPFTAVTPEARYPNMTAVHHDHHRSRESGATLLTVSLYLQNVRVVAEAQFSASAAQQPGGQADVYAGQVQTSTVVPVTSENLPPLTTSGSSLESTINGLRASPAAS